MTLLPAQYGTVMRCVGGCRLHLLLHVVTSSATNSVLTSYGVQEGAGYTSFLMPFDRMLWVMLLLTLVGSSLFMFGLDFLSRRSRLVAMEKAHGFDKVQERRKRGEHLVLHTILHCCVTPGQSIDRRSMQSRLLAAQGAICIL